MDVASGEARSFRFGNRASVAWRSLSILVRRIARASGAVRQLVLLGLVLALGCAAPAAASDVYVTNFGTNDVSQYTVGAGGALAAKPLPTIPAGTSPLGVAVSPDGHSVYVTNSGSNDVSQYDVGAGGALAAKSTPTVPADGGPIAVAVRATPSGPPPATIEDLIDTVEALALHHGIERSLLAKLTGAQRNTADDHLAGACAKLGSFINEVSAQSGKKIDADDAEELTDQAREVAQSLGCASP